MSPEKVFSQAALAIEAHRASIAVMEILLPVMKQCNSADDIVRTLLDAGKSPQEIEGMAVEYGVLFDHIFTEWRAAAFREANQQQSTEKAKHAP